MPVLSAYLGATILLLQLTLMLTVGLHRFSSNITLGVGTDQNLERKVRAHANLAENAAIFITVFTIAELSAVTPQTLTYLAITFVVARVLHAISFLSLKGTHKTQPFNIFFALRVIGTAGTIISGIALANVTLQHVL